MVAVRHLGRHREPPPAPYPHADHARIPGADDVARSEGERERAARVGRVEYPAVAQPAPVVDGDVVSRLCGWALSHHEIDDAEPDRSRGALRGPGGPRDRCFRDRPANEPAQPREGGHAPENVRAHNERRRGDDPGVGRDLCIGLDPAPVGSGVEGLPEAVCVEADPGGAQRQVLPGEGRRVQRHLSVHLPEAVVAPLGERLPRGLRRKRRVRVRERR